MQRLEKLCDEELQGLQFDFLLVQTSYQRPSYQIYNSVNTYTCKMTVGLKLKEQNSIEVFSAKGGVSFTDTGVCVCVCVLFA